ncbi:uncharacterized protein EV420DRAFT_311325 [Desarmillaria tabescens]|uniref:Uncharacterized protein n=1 Tax=Armillaria tabescens TaxID=1929756 RepID=A0AA39N6N2_ARMTA|nr:uncharacterized protein EV420DRAFT_311325 [Desarmillaria tabescens]KAK0459260.1 hypothetical protein EV420DRAFT_311325 [Desarmillaria tabescens]
MVAPASFNSISVAGQQVTQQIGNGNKSSKRASIFLSLRRREDSQNILDLNLGSPFLFEDVFSGLTPSPRSLEFKLPLPSAVAPSSPLPLFSSSFVEPFDAFVDSESDASDSEDEEDDTQYISIPSTSPFYHPPPKPRSFDFAPWSESCSSSSSMSFACDALSEDVGESAAILFHEKLDGIPYVRDDVFIVDDEFLHEAGTELYVSPFDVYQDMYLDMLKNPVGLMSLHDEDPCPDVPVDFDEENAHAEMYSGILPVTLEPVTVIPSVGRQSPMLDMRLVAPFEEAEAQLRNRASVVPPSSLFCGLFPQTNTAMRN